MSSSDNPGLTFLTLHILSYSALSPFSPLKNKMGVIIMITQWHLYQHLFTLKKHIFMKKAETQLLQFITNVKLQIRTDHCWLHSTAGKTELCQETKPFFLQNINSPYNEFLFYFIKNFGEALYVLQSKQINHFMCCLKKKEYGYC